MAELCDTDYETTKKINKRERAVRINQPRFVATLSAALIALYANCVIAQISGDVVKIGVLNDMDSGYSDISGMGSVVAARMAVADFGGTVRGKPIEIVFAGHQNKADVAATIARRWIDEEKVDAIADVGPSSAAAAVQEITRDRNRMFLISGAASSDLTGKACSPVGIHWTYDTYATANGTAKALVKQGGDTWFFLTADYTFGTALERDTTKVVVESGGKVLGSVRAPLGTSDYSSFLLTAQASGVKVVGLANSGADTINSIKQAGEFGIMTSGQRLAGLLVFITDVNSLGLQTAQGLVATTAFYWDMNDATRAWTKRFMALNDGKVPTMVQAGVYGAVLHYLKSVDASGTDEAGAVSKSMKGLPINDFFTANARVREDGRVMRDMYLVQVKSPSDSHYPFDYYKVLATIPASDAFRPLAEGGCPLIK